MYIGTMSWDEQAFKEKLDNNHEFPGEYVFKFIVKPEYEGEVRSLLEGASVKLKPSSGNKYISITLSRTMESSESVIEVYKKAHTIKGIIAL